MKRRFNTRIGRSVGLGAYRNRGSDYLELAPKYRTLCEQGRLDVISSTINYSTVSSYSSGYMETENIWKEIDKTISVWHKFTWLHEEIESWSMSNLERARKVYYHITKEYGEDYFNEMYIPVYYDNVSVDAKKNFSDFAYTLMHETAGKKSMELYNYAFRTLKDGRNVLYARKLWLKTFKSGCDIINYYRIASKRSFKKVYKF